MRTRNRLDRRSREQGAGRGVGGRKGAAGGHLAGAQGSDAPAGAVALLPAVPRQVVLLAVPAASCATRTPASPTPSLNTGFVFIHRVVDKNLIPHLSVSVLAEALEPPEGRHLDTGEACLPDWFHC